MKFRSASHVHTAWRVGQDIPLWPDFQRRNASEAVKKYKISRKGAKTLRNAKYNSCIYFAKLCGFAPLRDALFFKTISSQLLGFGHGHRRGAGILPAVAAETAALHAASALPFFPPHIEV